MIQAVHLSGFFSQIESQFWPKKIPHPSVPAEVFVSTQRRVSTSKKRGDATLMGRLDLLIMLGELSTRSNGEIPDGGHNGANEKAPSWSRAGGLKCCFNIKNI